VAGLDPGDHRVTITGSSGAPLVLVPVKIRGKPIQDLGTLIMLAGGTVSGLVHMEAGRSPAGIQVFLDGERDGRTTSADKNGRFQFEDVPPGTHEVNAKDLPGILAAGPPLRVEVAVGQIADVVLDLSMRGMCSVAVRVLIDGKPAEGVEVVNYATEVETRHESMGNTGADGWVRTSVPAAKAIRMGALAPDGAPLGWDAQSIQLPSGGSIEKVLELTATSLEIEWPADGAVPVGDPVTVVLTQGASGTSSRPFWVHGNAVPGPEGTTTHRCVLPLCGPGEYEVNVHHFKKPVGTSEGKWAQYRGHAIVSAGSPGHAVLQEVE